VPGNGQHSGRPQTQVEGQRRARFSARRAHWPYRRALLSLPGGQHRALARIGDDLAADDPELGLRLGFFTLLTREEPMPRNEHVPSRQKVLLHPAAPLVTAGAVTLVAVGWLARGWRAGRAGIPR
jgi:hypothetical protein